MFSFSINFFKQEGRKMVIVTHCVYETQLKLCFENLIIVKIALFYNYN